MEYCERGSLKNKWQERGYRLEEFEVRFYMFQVLSVLKYLRRQKIIHRDLTLANIFLKNNLNVKLGDFGFAIKENEIDENANICCGSPGYYTPESAQCKYSYKTDIFDFGVCIYLLGGKIGTYFQDSKESMDFFINKRELERNRLHCSEEAWDLINLLIKPENVRKDLDEIFVHPFFNRGENLTGVTFTDYHLPDSNNKDTNEAKEAKTAFENEMKKLSSNLKMTFTKKQDYHKNQEQNSRMCQSPSLGPMNSS